MKVKGVSEGRRGYAVTARQGIPENADLRREKREQYKEQRDRKKRPKRAFRRSTRRFFAVKASRFIDICDSGGNEEDNNIDPVGRFADDTVVRIEKDRDQNEAEKDAPQLDTPEILAVAEEKALRERIEKHRKKEKLHMLPGGFVDSRKGGDPYSFSEPIV